MSIYPTYVGDSVHIHIAFMVTISWLLGSNFGATTANPTKTPRWTARTSRSTRVGQETPLIGSVISDAKERPTKNAVRYESDIVKGHNEPSHPQHTVRRTLATPHPLSRLRNASQN